MGGGGVSVEVATGRVVGDGVVVGSEVSVGRAVGGDGVAIGGGDGVDVTGGGATAGVLENCMAATEGGAELWQAVISNKDPVSSKVKKRFRPFIL